MESLQSTVMCSPHEITKKGRTETAEVSCSRGARYAQVRGLVREELAEHEAWLLQYGSQHGQDDNEKTSSDDHEVGREDRVDPHSHSCHGRHHARYHQDDCERTTCVEVFFACKYRHNM